VTAFGKLIRTTAFRLTLFYLFLFALFAASLVGYFAWNTRRLITEQITSTVNVETSEIGDIYNRRAAARLQSLPDHHPRRAGDRRQCRLARARRIGHDRLVRDRLSAA
jgi:hypothetical protein